MPIDLQTEQIVALSGGAKALPLIDGKRPHPSTLWRWATKGLRGVRLDYVRIGHRLCTSHEALNRFVNALAETGAEPAVVAAKTPRADRARTDTKREREIARAEAELSAAGV